MADLDSLQVNITGSSAQAVSAIDKLIGALTKLNSALNNYKAGSEYTQGMNNLASGLDRVSKAINGINTHNIKDVTKAIAGLSEVGSKLSLGDNIARQKASIKAQSKALVEESKKWGVGNVVSLPKTLEEKATQYYEALAKGSKEAAVSAANDIHNLITEYVKFDRQLDNTGKRVREYLRGASVKWTEELSAEFGDDRAKAMSTLGLKNLSKDGRTMDVIAQELNGLFGYELIDTSSEQGSLHSLIEVLERAKNEMIDFYTAANEGYVDFSAYMEWADGLLQVAKSADQATPSIQRLDQQMDNVGNDSVLGGVSTALESIRNVGDIPDFSGLKGLGNNLSKLASVDVDKLGENLPLIANGLKSFEGLQIPEMSGVGNFAIGLKELNKLGRDSAGIAAQNLPKLASGLQAFNSIGQIPNLTGLNELATGLRSLGSGNIVKASEALTPIANGLRDLSGLRLPDEESINSLATLAKALNTFGRDTTAKAAENMPRLAQAFNELIASINQGNIEQKTVDFAQAMSQLSRSCEQTAPRLRSVQQQTLNWSNLFEAMGARVRAFNQGALNLLRRGMQNVGRLFADATNRVKGFVANLLGVKHQTEDTASTLNRLARSIGKFWASAFWIINGVRGLWKSVESSMNYIETLNYFKAAFRQVSDTAVGNWSKLGYESAEAYADSFEKRAKQLTTKMTGFELSDTGVLSMTGGKTLGLNPNTLLNYQAQFAQMASSMGASANNATLLSQALVEIGADLASVKNLNFEDVWKDMASGMVGMSRTLDKYGVNIRAAALNQKLLDLGIQATVKDLSGADKAMLRTIVLLDSTKYAWGDLANTINQPANQLRLLTANLQNCARMLGNIFLPLVAKVLPYLNAMAIAVQRLLTFIAQILGIDLSKITSSVGGAGDAMSDILDDADGLEDGLDDAAESAKKLKNNLLGVDELNVISDNVTSQDANGNMSSLLDDAFLDALSEYQKAWDEAFDKMENRANELADKIVKWFKDLFKPISDAWAKVGDKVKDAWEKAFTSLANLLKSVFKDVWDVWQSPVTTDIFENLFNILKDIGLIISHIADNFRKAWEEGGRGKAILEAIWDIVYAISKNAREVADAFVGWAKDLNFAPILESIKNLLRAIADNAYDIVGIFADWYTIVWTGIGKYLIEEFFPKVLDSLTKMVRMVDWTELRSNIDRIYTSLVELAKVVGGWLLDAWDRLATTIGNFLNSDFFGRLADSFERLVESLKNAKDINDVINAIFNFGDDRMIDVAHLVNTITGKLNEVLEKIDFRNLGARFAGLINTFLNNVDIDSLAGSIAGIVNGLFDLAIGFLSTLDWEKVGQAIGKAIRDIDWHKVFVIIWDALSGLGDFIKGMFEEAPVETTIIEGILAMFAANGIIKAVTGKGIAATIFEAILGNGTKGIGKESGALGALADAAGNAADGKTGVVTANKGLIASAKKGAKGLKTEVAELGAVEAAGKGASGVLGTIGTVLAGIAAAVGGFKVGTKINEAIDPSSAWAAKQAGGLKSIQELKENVKTYWEAVSLIFHDENISIGKRILEGIGAGIVAALATLVSPFVAIWNWFVDGVKSIFGIASPAKNVMFLGEDILLGIVEGFKEAWSAFWNAIGEFFTAVKEWFGEKFEELKGWFSEKWNGFKDSFVEAWENIKQAVSVKWQELKDAFTTFSEEFIGKVVEWATTTWGKISEWVETTKEAIGEWVESVKQHIVDWYNATYTKVSEWIENTKTTILAWVEEVKTTFQKWKDAIVTTVDEWKTTIENKISEWKTNIVQKLTEWYNDAKNAIENWFEETRQWFENWKTTIEETIDRWRESILNRFEEWKNNTLSKLDEWKNRGLEKIGEFINNSITTVQGWARDILKHFNDFKDWTHSVLEDWKTRAKGFIEEFSQTKERIREFATEAISHISDFATKSKENLISFYETGKQKVIGFVNETKGKFAEWKTQILDNITRLKDGAIKLFQDFYNGAKEWFTESKWSFDGIRDGLVKAFGAAFDKAVEMWDTIKEWLAGLDLGTVFQSLASGVKQVGQKAADAVKSVANAGKDAIDSAKKALSGNGSSGNKDALNGMSVKDRQNRNAQDLWDMLKNGRKFATGGFPEDGLFFANHNELVGGFSNGRTAVANNEQITDGIRQAVYDAFTSANANNREEQLLEELINAVRSGKSIQIDGRELVNAVNTRQMRNGFSFT